MSPFYLGPCELYDGYVSRNVENAWQFSKVYAEHVDASETPTEAYFEWAKTGWSDTKAHRYPMGKGAVPLFSYWNGEKLTYVEARRNIYIPLYAKALVKGPAFFTLVDAMPKYEEIVLRDFDGRDMSDNTFEEIINDPKQKMGHAFVIAMVLHKMFAEKA